MKRLYCSGLLSLFVFSLLATDQAILTGQLNELNIKEVTLETTATIATDEPLRTVVKVDADHTFKLTLDIPPSHQFQLKIGVLTLPLYLEGGDSLVVALESINGQLVVKYRGEGSSNNSFLFQYSIFEKKIDYTELEAALQSKDGQAYWDAVNKLNKMKEGFFEQYAERSKKSFSVGFKRFIDNQIKYKLVDELLAFHVYYRVMINLEEVKIPTQYSTYLSTVEFDDEEAVESKYYQSAILNWINFKNSSAYNPYIEDQLKRLADNYKIADEQLKGNTQYYTKYTLLKELLKADYVYAAYEYEDFLKSQAPQFLKTPLIQLHQIKSMKLDDLPMPNLKLLDQQGNSRSLSDFKGKIQYLCLWKNDSNTEVELSSYFRLFGKKVTQDSLVKFQLIYTAKSPTIWSQILKKQQRNLDYINHYRLDLSDELTRNFVLRTDDYGPLFILVNKEGVVVRDNASMSYEFNPNNKIRKLLKGEK